MQEITRRHKAICFVANEIGLDHNLKLLSEAVADYFQEAFSFDNFEKLFQFLANRSHERPVTLIIDEFTYLMAVNDAILSVIQSSLDQLLQKSQLKLILSGSHFSRRAGLFSESGSAQNQYHVYECKWSNKKIDLRVFMALQEKAKAFSEPVLGFFSKSGFDHNLALKGVETYTPKDLYDLQFENKT